LERKLSGGNCKSLYICVCECVCGQNSNSNNTSSARKELSLTPGWVVSSRAMSDDPTSGLTLKDVLQDETLAHLFRDFLHQLHSAENLAFWLDVEEFKTIADNYSDIRRQRATKIFAKYFSAASEVQVRPVRQFLFFLSHH